MKSKTLIHNARVLTQADGLLADSLAISRNRIVAVGKNLRHDPDFASFQKIDLKGLTVVPGLVDAHTHFYFFALSLARVSLQSATSMDECLQIIKKHASKLKKNEWVLGEGYALDEFTRREEPDRQMLDRVTDGRPAFMFSKDEHSAWVNSKALQLAGIDRRSAQPKGGEIVHGSDGEPTGVLREGPAYGPVHDLIPLPTASAVDRLYQRALDIAYRRGVTGVHSFDGPDGFVYLSALAERGKTGLRIDYYPPAHSVAALAAAGIRYGAGTPFFGIKGVKLFADGSLGSQTALCCNRYLGSRDAYGIEVTPPKVIAQQVRAAARLGLPAAIHAIGDRAVGQVLDVLEKAPALKSGGHHRIEHLQLIQRKDIARVKRLGITASMQPSHCPSDIHMVRKYWGSRGRNAYLFRTLLERGINLAFGSDCPIEPLNPLHGIAAAVRRARPGSRDVFYPEQRLTAAEALHGFTVGPALITGRAHELGRLMPGYLADMTILSDDPTRVCPSHLYDIEVLATIIDGKVKYADKGLGL